ncbi:autophagy-related protein 2 [Iris pallida]|uniref:Autophagy-related protein 2 n=1 Tax=Iris pallida TaxID=29817 RepID=A0AAX6FZ49_IRIPA|nr:autophagy-related protein 2 [Iris pallida]
MHAKVYEYHNSRTQAEGFGVPDYDSSSLVGLLLSKNLQKEVQGALPFVSRSMIQNHLLDLLQKKAGWTSQGCTV